MKKKLIGLSMVLILLLTSIPNFAQAKQPIKIIVNEKEVKSDVLPFINEGRTMVPVRFIAEALGMKVSYETIDGSHHPYGKESKLITLTSSSGYKVSIDDMSITSSDDVSFFFSFDDQPLMIKNSRTFVPIRYLANALHMDVTWNEDTNTVELNSNNNEEAIDLYLTPDNLDTLEFKETKSNTHQVVFKNGHYFLEEITTKKRVPYLSDLGEYNLLKIDTNRSKAVLYHISY